MRKCKSKEAVNSNSCAHAVACQPILHGFDSAARICLQDMVKLNSSSNNSNNSRCVAGTDREHIRNCRQATQHLLSSCLTSL